MTLMWTGVPERGRLFRILVVDDFVPFLGAVRLILQPRDDLQIVGQVSDGLEAIQKAQELKPDLILLDIGLPKLNGLEVGRRIRKVSPESKILFLTQESSSDVVREALGLGADGYILKTHAQSDLLTAIEMVLGGEQFVSRGLEFSGAVHVVDISYRRLDEIIARLRRVAKLRDLLDGILDAGIEITGADFGNIQLRNQGTDELKLVAHRGFGSDFVKFFETVHRGDNCVCGAAFKNAKQVVVEDVSTDPIFRNTEAGKIVLSADARACQSTPICGRSGELFGMLNTHHRRPCRPSDNSLQMLDFLAQHAGDLIQKHEGNPRRPG